MGLLRRASVRSRIAALLAVLIALWTFAAWVTARESLNLLYLSYLDNAGLAAEDVVEAVQRERRLSAVVLGGDEDALAELAEARALTDQRAAAWQDLVDRPTQRLAASDRLTGRYEQFAAELAALDQLRGEVDLATVDRLAALDAYTVVVEAGFAIYRAVSNLDDQEVARQSGLLVNLSEARELLAREDALLAGAQAAGELSEAEVLTFTQLVGGQRLLYERTVAELPAEDRVRYEQAAGTSALVELRRMEDQLMTGARPGGAAPVSAADWEPVATEAIAALRQVEHASVENLVQRATPVVVGIIIRVLVAGCLGLVAVILSVTTGRSLIRQLEQVRDAARELAVTRLPRVVRRLSGGEEVDVATEAPPVPDPGAREVAQLAAAFNTVQRAAIEAAVGQADLRRGVRDVFLSLARRTQNLVRRQLKVLDEAEQREVDPDKMAELFRIDHLATRMRRNAENLIVLAGASTARTWRHPVAMVNVVRGAISEVEDYSRVTVLAVDPGALTGQAVGDVIHLLAELVENAVSFSPPYAQVTVSGQRVARGFAVEIEDRGLGMSEQELATVNRSLAHPPDFTLANASHLGHYMVAKLAERHDIRVQLRKSPYGGVSAVVLIPAELITDGAGQPSPPAPEKQAPRKPAPGRQGARKPAPGRQGARKPAPGTAARRPGADRPAGNPAGPAAAAGASGGGEPGNPPGLTPAGLPWRVRQASMPRQLHEPGSGEPDGSGTDEPAPDPDTVRARMSAYQRGTELGRRESGATDTIEVPVQGSDRTTDRQEG